MKFSLFAIPALSAVALAAPSPTFWKNKDCVHKKPQVHYSNDYKGCVAYNADEIKYKLSCIWYHPQIKHCTNDVKDKDKNGKDKDGKDKNGKDKDGKDKNGKDKDGKDKNGKDKDGKY